MLQLPFIFFYMGLLALANPQLPKVPPTQQPTTEKRLSL